MQDQQETLAIPLTMGKVAIIDAADFDLVSGHKWRCLRSRSNFYAVRNIRGADGKQHKLRLHTAITGFAMVDHIDGDGLNNRRSNLREATIKQNNRNMRKQAGRSSQFKGVTWYKQTAQWRASIGFNGRHISLGYFDSEGTAAAAYDAAARLYFGEFATLNFPLEGENAALKARQPVLTKATLGAGRKDQIRHQAQLDASLVLEEYLARTDIPIELVAERAEYVRQFQLIATRLVRQSKR